MSLTHSPSVVTNGLVLYYDMPNGKSFVGGPVTNVLDGASVNGYPTYDNGWGTYNTNNYNGGAYFSIGTISSISGNIINTSAAHPLYTYNVVNPQSSGGGVTAGTNYVVKKLSSTSFSLHAWNGSQDGSQGYINPATGNHKVFDDFANDVRISVSDSGFPTMWWGAPHVANSCIVKEIIPGGFTGILGRTATNCIRLHWIQPDGITDGMAYGPNAPVVAGQVYTVSFWTRSVTPSAVGQSLSYYIYNHGVVAAAGYGFNAVLGPVGVWTKHSMTFTPVNPNCISYWFPSTGNMKVDLANIQFEAGSIANNFAPGTRYANNNLESTPNYPSWNQSAASASGGTLTFTSGSYNSKGTWDLYKTYSGLSTGTNYTWSALVKKGTATNFIVTMNNTNAWNTGPANTFSEFSSTEWKRVSITGTTNTGSFNIHLGASNNTEMANVVQSGGTLLIQDVRLQLTGSQTAIQDLIDQNTIIPTSLTYASDGTFSFDGSSNYISAPLNLGTDPVVTINQWIKRTSSFSNGGYWGLGGGSGNNGINGYTSVTNKIGWDLWGQSTFHTGQDYPLNQWVNVCWVKTSTTFTTSTLKVYINGVEFPLSTIERNNSSAVNLIGGIAVGRIAPDFAGYYAPGQIGITQVYNRGLSALEVQQNFNAQRGRYGI